MKHLLLIALFSTACLISYAQTPENDDYLTQQFALINAALDTNPHDADAYAARANLYFTLTDFDQAESDIKKAIKYSNGYPVYRAMLCQVHVITGRNSKALREANALIRDYPDYPQPYLLRAFIMVAKADTAKYVDDYMLYLQLSHDLDLSPVYDVADTYYDYIMEYASQILAKAISRENIAYWNYFIEGIKENAGDPTAFTNLDIALQYADDQELVCRLLISKSGYYAGQERYDSALIVTQRVIDSVEMNDGLAAYWLYMNKGIFLNRLERYAEADSAYTVSLTRTIDDPGDRSDICYLRYKIRLQHLHDSLAALADLDSAIAFTPASCHLLYARARLCAMLGNTDQASTDYENILLLDTVVSPSSYRHFALAALGRRAEAEQWLSQVIDRNDNERLKPSILYNAACMYSLLRDPATAIKYLMDAMALSPIDCDQIRNDADFDPIRNTPEFQSILRVSCSDL